MVRDMWSADHFDKTIKCSMTDLSEIIGSLGDTIFKVSFKKKVDEKKIEDKLMKLDQKDLKDEKFLSKFAKETTEGENCEMTCHLLESDNNLGRSLVIDLNASAPSNFRQVDHRTIEYIIYKNVKYQLGKRDPGYDELPVKVDHTQPKWKEANLVKGNWFS
jgi:hypothetical protein